MHNIGTKDRHWRILNAELKSGDFHILIKIGIHRFFDSLATNLSSYRFPKIQTKYVIII